LRIFFYVKAFILGFDCPLCEISDESSSTLRVEWILVDGFC